MTHSQLVLYDTYVKHCLDLLANGANDRSENLLLEVISSMRKIVNHPYLFYAYHNKVKLPGHLTTTTLRSLDLENVSDYRHYL